VCSVALVSAASHEAAAATTTPAGTDLGAIGFTATLVDNNNHHVFVSGQTANVVEVLDFSGKLLTTINNVYGAAGMVINNGMLYVAESTSGRIARIHLRTLARARDLGSGLIAPYWLAITGGKLWVTVNALNGWGQLESMNLTTGVATLFSAPSYYGLDIATSPGDDNTIFLAEDGLSPGSIYRLDVSSGTPVVVTWTYTNQENLEQIVVSADGKRVIPASGAPYYFQELSATTLQPGGVIYPGQPYPSAVAVSSRGAGRVATGESGGWYTNDINVDPLGTPAPIFTATTLNTSGTENIDPHGLALTASGTTLFAVGDSAVVPGDAEFWAFPVS
jgi:hypothetical protein